ncbi:hypothetical protein [Caballeronia sp. S22]|uniref:hypothetical protein n=1 Tax=Caballeronia sp. S22 TaxID=3137182 RepID=UPI0035312057
MLDASAVAEVPPISDSSATNPRLLPRTPDRSNSSANAVTTGQLDIPQKLIELNENARLITLPADRRDELLSLN